MNIKKILKHVFKNWVTYVLIAGLVSVLFRRGWFQIFLQAGIFTAIAIYISLLVTLTERLKGELYKQAKAKRK